MLLIYTVFLPYFIKLYTVIYIYIYFKCYLLGGSIRYLPRGFECWNRNGEPSTS